MTTEVTIIDPKEFGLEKSNVVSIEQAFAPKIAEREELTKQYELIITKEISEEVCQEAIELKRKLGKVRISIANVHKAQKAYALSFGKYCDAWKNKETLPITQMEEILDDTATHFQQLRMAEIMAIKIERMGKLEKFGVTTEPFGLEDMTDEQFNTLLIGSEVQHKQKIEVEAKVEAERIEANAALERERERIRLENIELKKQAEARELELKIEADKRESERLEQLRLAEIEAQKQAKTQADLEAKRQAEIEAERLKAKQLQDSIDKAKREQAIKEAEQLRLAELELSKGDAAKVQDLIKDLEALKTKYSFKSAKSKRSYIDVGVLIDKVILHIK